MSTNSNNAAQSKRFNVGDITYVSHGYNRKASCGGAVAVVVEATERTFTQQCRCGAKFGCQQSDNYPNKTQGRGWETYHEH